MTAAKYHHTILDRLVVLYAQFYKPMDISAKLNKEFGVSVSMAYINRYVLRPGTAVHTKMLTLRKLFCKEVMNISISQKVVRMRELELIVRANSGATDRDSIRAVISALQAAREEIEGSKIVLDISEYNGVTDETLRTRKLSIVRELARAEGFDIPANAFTRIGTDRFGAGRSSAENEADVLHSESDPILFPHIEDSD